MTIFLRRCREKKDFGTHSKSSMPFDSSENILMASKINDLIDYLDTDVPIDYLDNLPANPDEVVVHFCETSNHFHILKKI